MSRQANYVAVYQHDQNENVWLVHIKGIESCHTYGRTLRQAESRIREALAVWLDKEPDGLVITSEYPRDLSLLATKVSQARYQAARAGDVGHGASAAASLNGPLRHAFGQ